MIVIKPIISIIVPVYNVEAYLVQCVESVLAQSFTEFEVLLIDDGSTDNCPAVCDSFAQRDPRVRVIHQRNSGLSMARNVGIDCACGEYLCFVDSDDYISPEYCNTLYKTAVSLDVNMVACRMTRFVDGENICDATDGGAVTIFPFPRFLKEQMTRNIEMGVCNRLFHRNVLKGIRFEAGRLHEDIIFAGDLLVADFGNVAYVDESLYYYRQRDNSIVNQQACSARCSSDRIYSADYLLQCAKKVKYAYMEECLAYAVKYPWSFVDSIYVRGSFGENRQFLNLLQKMIRDNIDTYLTLPLLDNIQRKRIRLFACSKFLYGFNAYGRLLRVYIYRIFKLDAYSDGHGI